MLLIFITHIVRCSSIFLSSRVNFCMLTHKFSHRCTHCHHTHFIFITKQSILASFITRVVAKTILHAHYFVNLQTFLSSTINFLSTSMAHHHFLLQCRNAILFLSCMCYLLAAPVFENNRFFTATHFCHFSTCKIITTYISCTNQNGQKIIFCCRIIINNVVLTHIFANRFAKLSQLLQKLLVALHYTLLLSHFLLFVFQFIPHSWFTYFAPTRTLINAAAKNCMNDFAYYSCSLAVSFSIACTSSYTKKIYSMK